MCEHIIQTGFILNCHKHIACEKCFRFIDVKCIVCAFKSKKRITCQPPTVIDLTQASTTVIDLTADNTADSIEEPDSLYCMNCPTCVCGCKEV